ncbi:hypothetical protein N9C66_10815 [Akkermansiaceae bacterium]|jgi:hypothetical protein|nr:hypothetical protein [Akkermansiaceae bacterium]MDA9831816.1 hypothetical protein [Akkermansiaceae bacterium]MDB4465669.1 hypothetical protein [Akkermansiaceae bacterium]
MERTGDIEAADTYYAKADPKLVVQISKLFEWTARDKTPSGKEVNESFSFDHNDNLETWQPESEIASRIHRKSRIEPVFVLSS